MENAEAVRLSEDWFIEAQKDRGPKWAAALAGLPRQPDRRSDRAVEATDDFDSRPSSCITR
jgi:hypothetical protein